MGFLKRIFLANKNKNISVVDKIRNLGVKVGNNCRFIIYPNEWDYPNFGSEPYLIEIGDNTCISFGCTFLTHDASVHVCEKFLDNNEKLYKFGKIKIGNNCFIGCKSIILPDVTIGDNVVIGAGSVVTKDIPDNEVWAGNPAKYISSLEEYKEKLLCLQKNSRQEELKQQVELSRIVSKNKEIKINFITEFDETVGSTRSRIIKLQQFLSKNICAEINGDISLFDIIVFQKGTPQKIYPLFKKALLLNKFIIFDVDDWDYGVYKKFIKYSDLVFVGSSYLKTKWFYLNKSIVVLDDPIDVIDKNIELAKYDLSRLKIGWFGNVTNLPALKNAQIQNVTTITKGGDIEWSKEDIDYNLQKFDLIVIPTEKSEYGLAKGNCRMLKCLYLGIPALVSDLAAYTELAELVNYPKEFIVHDGENWQERINLIKNGDIKFNFDFKKAREILLSKYSSEARGNEWISKVKSYYSKKNKIISFIKFLVM